MLSTVVENDAKQYIIATIGVEQYGIDIGFIDNIVKLQKITRIPKSQKFFLGVINLRGEIIPVMSLRTKFGYDPDEFGNNSRIIILKPDPQQADKIGILVDTVKEVLTLSEDCIEHPQHDANDARAKYINGVGKHNESLISLFNIPTLINENLN